MQPLVSVIIPAYNSAPYIKEALDSVFNQTYKNLEIIVVDDGSSDNTREILRPYSDRFTYIYKENGGPASARNLGIKNAKGEYIAFLDADDIWLPDKLIKQVNLIKKEGPIGLVHTGSFSFEKLNNNEIFQKHNFKSKSSDYGYRFSELFWHNFIKASSVLAKKDCFDELGLFDEDKSFISVEDYDMWLRISNQHKIAYINEQLFGYRIHPGGISKDIDRSYLNEKKVIEKVISDYPDIEKVTGIGIKSRFAKLYLDYGLDFLVRGDMKEAREKLAISLKYFPFSFKTIKSYLKTFIPAYMYRVKSNLKIKNIITTTTN